MFYHNFKYAFRVLFRNRMLIFWTFAFPIILGTFFQLAFSDIEKNEQLDIIEIAVVQSGEIQQNEVWKASFDALSDEASEDQLFHTRYVDETTARDLLEAKEIAGYVTFANEQPKVVVTSDGIDQTILKYVTEEISQTEDIVQNAAVYQLQSTPPSDMQTFYAQLYGQVTQLAGEEYAKIKDVSGENLSYTMIEFYTLIAMTCLYGGLLGMTAVNQSLANMSHQGKRVSVSPTSKGKLILSNVLAGYLTQLIGVALLFVYTIFVLRVNYGSNLPAVVLLTLCGCLAGLCMGIAIAVLVKSNENTKTGIVISATMAGCFLSGMMGITMKYMIDKNIPLLNRINPANMITDGLYAIYYYDTPSRYLINVGSLLLFSLIMIVLSVAGLRRQKYDCI